MAIRCDHQIQEFMIMTELITGTAITTAVHGKTDVRSHRLK